MGPEMRKVVGLRDRYTRGGNFVVECGAPHCNQWGVCGVTVRKCVNRRSRSFIGSAEAWCIRWGPPRARGNGGLHGFCSQFSRYRWYAGAKLSAVY